MFTRKGVCVHNMCITVPAVHAPCLKTEVTAIVMQRLHVGVFTCTWDTKYETTYTTVLLHTGQLPWLLYCMYLLVHNQYQLHGKVIFTLQR